VGRAPPRLRVQLLGELRCWQAEKLIPPQAWKTAKTRALFAMLISERGRVFSQAQLAEQLWPDSEDALALVRRRISELRYILEPELERASLSRYIVRRSHGYCFTLEADCWVDTEEFARYEQQGRAGERVGNWPAAIEAYKKASQFYQGDFLAGDEGDWAYLMRDHWRERYLYVMARLAECYSQLGQYHEAIEVCHRALQVDPLYEESHRQLMLYHYNRGERTQALQIYEDYRRRLAEELGLSPSPRMEELRQQIIQGRVSAPPVPPPAGDPAPYSLAQLPFVGRETESAQLQKYLQDAQAGQGCLVLISGEPGVGKTRLAQEVLREAQRDGALVLWGRCREGAAESPYLPLAEALRDAISHFRYEDFAPIKPLWLAEIATLVPELRTLLPQLPQNPALDPHQAQWRLFEAVAQLFSGLAQLPRLAKPLVLWLDDLQWAVPTLLDLLDHLCHRLAESPICIIGAYRSTEVTANHPLYKKLITGCQQSHHLRLSRLPYAAIKQMLSQVGPKLPPELCHVIYRESKGNPLFVTMLLQELFHRKIVTVAADGRWVCPKIDRLRSFAAQGITALFRQQLARLSPTEESVLHLAAVIGRDFDYELLRAAWGQSIRGLDNALRKLCELGLLDVTGPELRYDFTHDRLRELVSDEIGAERPLLHRRVARALERIYAPELASCSGRLAYHYDRAGEFSAALRYASEALEQAARQYYYDEALQMAEIGLRAATKLARSDSTFRILLKRIEIYHRLGRRSEQERDIKALFALQRELKGKLTLSLQAEAYRARAVFCRAVGRYNESTKAAMQMLALLQRSQDRAGEVKALLLLGSCYWVWGRYSQARVYAERARALSKKMGDRESLGDALHLLGQINAHRGAHRDACRNYRSALQIRQQIGDQPGIAYSLNNLGNYYRAAGEYHRALSAYRQSLAFYEEIGNEQGRGRVLSDMADLYCYLGCYEQALRYTQEAYEIQEIVRDLDNKAQTLMVRGHVFEGLGQMRQALSCYRQARALFERVKDVRGVCHALNSIGSVLGKLSQSDQALRSYTMALSRLHAIEARDVQVECLTGMGLVYLQRGQKAKALICTQQAVGLLECGIGHVAPQQTYFVHAQALRANGHFVKAKEYLQKSHEELLRRARSIRDRKLRRSFLSCVETNRAILAAAQRAHL
jgi:tetratricopeptide (TPR) repeat protein